MSRRPRIKHILSFSERLENEAARLLRIADGLPPGLEQDHLIAKAAQMESAREIDDWLRTGTPASSSFPRGSSQA